MSAAHDDIGLWNHFFSVCILNSREKQENSKAAHYSLEAAYWPDHSAPQWKVSSIIFYLKSFSLLFLPSQCIERKHLTHPNTCMSTIQPIGLTPLRVQFHDTQQPPRNSRWVMSHSSIVRNLSPCVESSAAWKKKHPSGNFERGLRIWDSVYVCVSGC